MNDAPTNSTAIEAILQKLGSGDESAAQELFRRYRPKIKRMISVRMDTRMSGRIDPSDVVQDTFLTAHKKLKDYLAEQPVAFYPWLRKIAWERLIDLQRKHIVSARRSVHREFGSQNFGEESRSKLVDQLVRSETGPLQHAARKELGERVDQALDSLSASDREVLVLRMLEQLSIRDTADVIGISVEAIKKRQARALLRLRQFLDDVHGEDNV